MKPYRTRVYLPESGLPEIHTSDPELLGIRKTLRLQTGDAVATFNGDGTESVYRIVDSKKNSLLLRLENTNPNLRDLFPPLTVLIASTKGKTKERMVKDLTPLGVTCIIFYHADRSVSQPEKHQAERLRKTAIEACRQCGRSTIPQIDIIPFSFYQPDFAAGVFENQTIFFYEEADTGSKIESDPTEPLTLIFGPEGGFSEAEIHEARTRTMQFGSLGKRILRSELAVVVGTTMVQSLRGVI